MRFHHWLRSNLVDDSRMGDVLNWVVFFGFAFWRIWYWRNQFLFNQTSFYLTIQELRRRISFITARWSQGILERTSGFLGILMSGHGVP